MTKSWILSFVSAGLVVLSVPAMGAVAAKCCVPGKPTAASYTWNFKGEANAIFKNVQNDAVLARSHADQLQAENRFDQIDWQVQEVQLQALKHDIDQMGAGLCRLEVIHTALAPWQQREVRRIANVLPLMADNTTDAINFMNAHQDELWLPAYQRYSQNLYAESSRLAHSSREAVAYAHVSRKYRHLQRELAPSAS